jgi:hypothetical protein
MSRFVRFAALSLLLLLGPARRDAAACDCAPAPGCDADTADVLFVGQIVDVWEGKQARIARMHVERAVRGAQAGQTLTVLSWRTSCGLPFEKGQRWLIATGSGRPQSIEGHEATLVTAACSGSFRIRPGDAGPSFPTRSDVGGRVSRRSDETYRAGPAVKRVRVWVTTPGGVIESRTDQDGDFLLHDVPLAPALDLHVDLPPGEAIRPVRLGVWTPETCGSLDVLVEPVRKPPAPGRAR